MSRIPFSEKREMGKSLPAFPTFKKRNCNVCKSFYIKQCVIQVLQAMNCVVVPRCEIPHYHHINKSNTLWAEDEAIEYSVIGNLKC